MLRRLEHGADSIDILGEDSLWQSQETAPTGSPPAGDEEHVRYMARCSTDRSKSVAARPQCTSVLGVTKQVWQYLYDRAHIILFLLPGASSAPYASYHNSSLLV